MRGTRGGTRRTRTAATATTAVAVLLAAAATGCGGGADDGVDAKPAGGQRAHAAPAQTYATDADLPESLAPDGTTVRVGSPSAKTVVHVYEDMRCPVCERFETQGGGEALREMVRSGQVRAEYTLASFLDGKLGGQGSKKAANALRAALDAGRFVGLHDALFAHQPDESIDGYTDTFLLRTASQVPGLRGTEFDAAVKGMKHRSFVTASEKAFDTSGATGTPTLKVNGKIVPQSLAGGLFDKQSFPMVIGSMSR
ncbi:thioredoxin domain-containing protein [Streptomyces sp. NPDC049915]|uniref:DsbA family protein n=1 Tax=Streptomyces sp. NPDC049915 TaxID=3155510 RepID=UPI003423C6FE